MVILDEGARIGPYRVRSLIFRAPLFDVYSATGERGAAVCALYCEREGRSLPAEPEWSSELEKLRALRVARFPRVLAGGRDDRAAWLVTEAIGGTAPIWTPGAAPIHWLRAFMTLGQSNATAFADAARAGVYHGTLTPDCLREWPNGAVCVVGMGTARLFGMSVDVLRASPRYCAPEQLQEGAIPSSERTDIYSIGMCLHAFTTGREPFEDAAGLELIGLAQHGSPDFSLLSGAPTHFRELLERCCAKSASDRSGWDEFAQLVGITILLCRDQVPESTRLKIFTDKLNQLGPDTLNELAKHYSQAAGEAGDPGGEPAPDVAAESSDRTPPAGDVAEPLVVPISAPALIAPAPSNDARGPTTVRVPAPPASLPKEPPRDLAAEAPNPKPPRREAPAAPSLKGKKGRARVVETLVMLGGVCVALAAVMMSESRLPVASAPSARSALSSRADELEGAAHRFTAANLAEPARPAPPPARTRPRIVARNTSLKGSCGKWFNCAPLSEEVR